MEIYSISLLYYKSLLYNSFTVEIYEKIKITNPTKDN